MKSKARELRWLSAALSDTPLTFWNLESFDHEAPDDRHWRIRAADDLGIPRQALSRGEVLEVLRGREGDFAIQEMLTSHVAGATYLSPTGRCLSEFVMGDAKLFLREGGRGARILDAAEQRVWTDDPLDLEGAVDELK